jgi:GNAT superfamily N-acetyltransferase
MEELKYTEYEKAKPFFKGLQLNLLLCSILEKNSPAQIWIDDSLKPKSFFLWDKANNVFYPSGYENNDEFNNQLGTLIKHHILPELRKRNRLYWRVQVPSDYWIPKLQILFEGINHTKRRHRLYIYENRTFSNWRKDMPAGFCIEEIDQGLLYSQLKNINLVIEEIQMMWPSIDRFMEVGFGFCLLARNEVVSWCTAEYVSSKKCGIGIETIPEYRNRGFATLTANAFIDYCICSGITPHWECDIDNVGSVRVAEKVGFMKVMDYDVYSAILK